MIGRWLLCCSLLGAFADVAAQGFPNKPVHILVPFAPGGTVDIAARLVGQQLSRAWGQAVVVENRPGGKGFIATSAAARATPDGYTLLMGSTGEFVVNPAIYRNVPYDVERDFAPISLISETPLTIATATSSTLETVDDVIAEARRNPGRLTFATPGTGTWNQLAGEWFASNANITLVHVPYRGGAPAAAAVAAGEVAIGVLGVAAIEQLVKGGRVKVIAVMAARRLPDHPDWKTVQEAGVADINASNWVGFFAPKGTPVDVVEKISRDTVAALQSAEVRRAFEASGAAAVGSSPEALTARVRRELEINRAIARKAGVKGDD